VRGGAFFRVVLWYSTKGFEITNGEFHGITICYVGTPYIRPPHNPYVYTPTAIHIGMLRTNDISDNVGVNFDIVAIEIFYELLKNVTHIVAHRV
jgi:hypothetical protein